MRKRFFSLREKSLLLIFIIAQLSLLFGYQVFIYLYRIPPVRVVVPYVSQFSSMISPYGLGVDGELLSRFAKEYGYTITLTRVRSSEEAWELIGNDKADMLVGFGGEVPEELKKKVTAGVAYDSYRSITIKDTKQADNEELQALCASLLEAVPDGVDEEVYRENAGFLNNFAEKIPEVISLENNTDDSAATAIDVPDTVAAPEATSRKEAAEAVRAVKQDALESVDCVDFDRFHMYHLMAFDGEEGGSAEIDVRNFTMLQPFFLDVVAASKSKESISYRWFWRDKFFLDSKLQNNLAEFWENAVAEKQIEALKERHYSFFPDSLNYYVIGKLKRALRRKVPIYAKTMEKAAKKYDVDPLLLSAVIFQESHFNSKATSRTGVRGLLQITQATARELGINRLDPHQSIMGGAAYLKTLWKRFAKYELEHWDRWFFTLAAYNQGFGHVTDAMKLAKKRGGTGRTWRELKDVLPLLAWKKYYSKTRYGYCRGYEAVTYVENIRYYYYLINGLVALSRPEGENLGKLRSRLGAFSSGI